MAENREGGCHDLPLICEGMSISTDYSADGWKWLWSLMKTDDSRCLFFFFKKNPCLFSFVADHMVEKYTHVVASLCDPL